MTDPIDLTETDALIYQAAQLRAEGMAWADIGKAVGRAEDTVQAWPRKRAEQWYPALARAVSEIFPECEREAVGVLRAGLRHTDKKGQWIYTEEGRKAASALLRHIRDCRAKSIELGIDGGGGIKIVITPAVKPEEEGE